MTFEARVLRDPARALVMLEHVKPRDSLQEVDLLIARAEALLGLERDDEARAALASARERGQPPDSLREMEALVVLVSAQRGAIGGKVPDRTALLEAGQTFAELSNELLEVGQTRQGLLIGDRATNAFALAGDTDRAERMLETLSGRALESADREVLSALGETASVLQRWDLVAEVLTASPEALEDQLVLAEFEVRQGGQRTQEAEEDLRRLLDNEREDVRRRAHFALLAAAVEGHIAWDQSVASALGETHASTVAELHSEMLRGEDRLAEAERVLVPHASDLTAARMLLDLAVERGELERAVRLADDIARRPGAATGRPRRAAACTSRCSPPAGGIDPVDDRGGAGELTTLHLLPTRFRDSYVQAIRHRHQLLFATRFQPAKAFPTSHCVSPVENVGGGPGDQGAGPPAGSAPHAAATG